MSGYCTICVWPKKSKKNIRMEKLLTSRLPIFRHDIVEFVFLFEVEVEALALRLRLAGQPFGDSRPVAADLKGTEV